jgi:ABC-type transport system involved in cytochrome c biogenesis permease subunit
MLTSIATFQARPKLQMTSLWGPLALVVITLGFSAGSLAQKVDWSSWEELPVFHNGRVMPLISFAEETVELICGRANPLLLPPESSSAEVTRLFPDGQPRRFRASELLLSWILEPEVWEEVPFLWAGHEDLRNLLQLPLRDAKGNRLRYVSPRHVSNSARFREQLRQLAQKTREAESQGNRVRLTALEESCQRLYRAFSLYQMLTYRPGRTMSPWEGFWDSLVKANQAFRDARTAWDQLEPFLGSELTELSPETISSLFASVRSEFHKLAQGEKNPDEELLGMENVLVTLGETANRLVVIGERICDHVFSSSFRPAVSTEEWSRARAQANQLLVSFRLFRRNIRIAHLHLYEPSYVLRVIPSLEPEMLRADRDTEEEARVWLALTTVLYGSRAVLAGYPDDLVETIRRNYERLQELWRSEGTKAGRETFSEALAEFARSVRELGQAASGLRDQLAGRVADPEILAATAYPASGALWPEITYHRLRPFLWAWVSSLLAVISFGLSFGVLRRPAFMVAMAAILTSAGFLAAGLAFRSAITGYTPVTNMFETVVFVALVTALVGLWFVGWPLFGTGLVRAWRATAIPGTFEATPLSPEELAFAPSSWWNRVGWGLTLIRGVLAVGVLLLLTSIRSGAKGGEPVFTLLPRGLSSGAMNANEMVVWLVGLAVVITAMWLVPRLLLALVITPVFLPRAFREMSSAELWELLLKRRAIGIVTAGVTLLAALVAYIAPISGKRIAPLMPVLRDNFWLTLHVVTITASYGVGALVWGLANLSLGYFLFGRYRSPEEASPTGSLVPSGQDPSGTPRPKRPPEACTALTHFMYRGMQVAVLLLAAGTIFGGLWADVSWGRFWGWDSKEVWALIALLVYLGVLHGRLTGMLNEFGLAVGAIFGATAIIIAWYGVNFVFGSGLHSYGEGTGGGAYVTLALVVNWLFVGAAWLRYSAEMRSTPAIAATSSSPQPAADTTPS